MTDLKATRNKQESGRRPALSILPYNGEVYAARGLEYGADKYSRANYFGPPPAGVDPVDRFLEYLDAAQRHIGKIAQAINIAKGTGGDQRAACALPDDEASGNFPASNLPHIAHAIAGLMIAVECGITDGLLPADPGQPWKRDPMYAEVLARRGGAPAALAQKDDPDAERRRVEAAADAVTKANLGDSVDLDGEPATALRKLAVASLRGNTAPVLDHQRVERHAYRPAVVGDRVRIITAGTIAIPRDLVGKTGKVEAVHGQIANLALDTPSGAGTTLALVNLQVIE